MRSTTWALRAETRAWVARGRHRHRLLRLQMPRRTERYGPGTELVIDGFMGSASTFTVHALSAAQPRGLRIAGHLHSPGLLLAASGRGTPTLLVVRPCADAVLSLVGRRPEADVVRLVRHWLRFHQLLVPAVDDLVVATFDDVTHDLGGVVARLNRRFATGLAFGSQPPVDDFVADPELLGRSRRRRREIREQRRPQLAPVAEQLDAADRLYRRLSTRSGG